MGEYGQDFIIKIGDFYNEILPAKTKEQSSKKRVKHKAQRIKLDSPVAMSMVKNPADLLK